MFIDQDRCDHCAKCVAYCPVGAIHVDKAAKRVHIDSKECVECGVCLRSSPCAPLALTQDELLWPRTVRSNLSNPLIVHKETRIPGRGTEEMKTNDITGRYKRGDVGIAMEMGRPGLSTSMAEVQRVLLTLVPFGIRFEPQNPVTFLMTDQEKGLLNPEVLGERVLSAIIEFELPIGKVKPVMEAIRRVAGEIDTVFSLNMCCLVEPDGSLPMLALLEELGIQPSPNGKHNVGLGKPAYDFFGQVAVPQTATKES